MNGVEVLEDASYVREEWKNSYLFFQFGRDWEHPNIQIPNDTHLGHPGVIFLYLLSLFAIDLRLVIDIGGMKTHGARSQRPVWILGSDMYSEV